MSNITQYEIDSKGEFASLFKAIRKIILSYPDISEVKNAKQTSYHDSYGVLLMMRTKGNTFVVALGKGATLQAEYPMLLGSGKIVRHLHYRSLQELDERLLREILEESFILGMEDFERKQLRRESQTQKA